MPMAARFPGNCNGELSNGRPCGARVAAGTQISFTKGRITGCPTCAPTRHGVAVPGEPVPEPVTLQIKVQRVGFTKPADGFAIIDACLHECAIPADAPIAEGRAFVVKGNLGPKVAVGDVFNVYGAFVNDPRYGWQYAARRAIRVLAGTDVGLRAWLAGFPQVGPVRSSAILQHFGSRQVVIEVLETRPEALAVIPGITAERALEIGRAFVEQSALTESVMFLAELQVSESLLAQVLETYGQDAQAEVRADPYQLMTLEGVGFKTADDIRVRLNVILRRENTPEIGLDDPRRLAAAVLQLLDSVEREGHTWATEADLEAL